MRKIGILVFVLIVLLLAVSCKQEIDCKLNTPSWARGSWALSGTMTVSGEGSLTLKGTYNVISDNIYGTITYVEAGTTMAVDLKSDLDGHKDYIVDFSQSSSSSEYSISYTEFLYVNGLTYASIQATLSPL